MQDTTHYRGWLYSVLIAIDQLGNALAGGYADSTISARVGYNARDAAPASSNYWRLLEWVINYTFMPLDGRDLMRIILSETFAQRPYYYSPVT